jgi:hypothetical protein
MEWRIEIVPAEDFQCWKVFLILALREMSKADLALVAQTVIGDEEQVVRRPSGALGAVGRGPFLERDLTQNAAQSDDRKFFRLELDEKDAPRLLRRERTSTPPAGHLWRPLPPWLRVGQSFPGIGTPMTVAGTSKPRVSPPPQPWPLQPA